MSASSKFSAISLHNHPYGEAVCSILSSSLSAVDPATAVQKNLQVESLVISAGHPDETGSIMKYDLEKYDRIKIIGFGKAALAMSRALVEKLTPVIGEKQLQGLIIGKHPPSPELIEYFQNIDGQFEFITSGHPIPNECSLMAGKKVFELISGTKETDLIFCLISGGGSALVTLPYPEISLPDFQKLTSDLLESGARIDEINCLRRHLDQFKGGGLARRAYPAALISLILSDVVNSPLEAIASGPTAPDPASNLDALAILEKYSLKIKVPLAILEILNSQTDTPKAGDQIFSNVKNLLVGNNYLACMAAIMQAKIEGFTTFFLGDTFQGEARELSIKLLGMCKFMDQNVDQLPRPFCVIAGGESTVTLHGNGLGGRNQELALAAVKNLSEIPNVMLVTMGTDGEDGPTSAAGAVVTSDTLRRGVSAGMDAAAFLENNDSYHYFDALGDLLITGPTGTNVNDITFIFGF